MDEVRGWNVKGWAMDDEEPDNMDIGGHLAACLWIHTNAVMCNGLNNLDEFRVKKRNSVSEAVKLAWSRVLPNLEGCLIFP